VAERHSQATQSGNLSLGLQLRPWKTGLSCGHEGAAEVCSDGCLSPADCVLQAVVLIQNLNLWWPRIAGSVIHVGLCLPRVSKAPHVIPVISSCSQSTFHLPQPGLIWKGLRRMCFLLLVCERLDWTPGTQGCIKTTRKPRSFPQRRLELQ
jgi:hypothetical protein